MGRISPLQAGRKRVRPDKKTAPFPNAEKMRAAYPFEDISPDLTLNISKRARRMALRLDPKTRTMALVIPHRASMRAAYLFAHENRDWIREKIGDLPQPVPFEDGQILPIFGRDRQIVICYNEALRYTSITLRKDEIIVLTNKPDPSQRIRRFLMDEAKKRITELSHEKAALIRRKVASVTVKDTKSRWGSCSDDGHISFSWRLIFAPPKAFDYVVAHEVAHLQHMDHSSNFWDACARICWDYEEGRGWMDTNGPILMRYGA